jgi:hypothetical protein
VNKLGGVGEDEGSIAAADMLATQRTRKLQPRRVAQSAIVAVQEEIAPRDFLEVGYKVKCCQGDVWSHRCKAATVCARAGIFSRRPFLVRCQPPHKFPIKDEENDV